MSVLLRKKNFIILPVRIDEERIGTAIDSEEILCEKRLNQKTGRAGA